MHNRVWIDGCFDMMHYGHANALRQARAMGDYLVVGVHSDAEIIRHKGPPVMNEQERYAAVRACKWVDEVVEGAPYSVTIALMDRYGCDFCAHGDDLAVAVDGKDAFEEVKLAGRYKEFRRTMSVSTTNLVGRMLLLQSAHAHDSINGLMGDFAQASPATAVLAVPLSVSTNRIAQFSSNREPELSDRIVYVDGTFDLFHVGHIDFLQRARHLGDYLIVGVHDDHIVKRVKGHAPVMLLAERALGVLSCRHVDEVLIGAPYSITPDMISKYRITVVAHGGTQLLPDTDGQDPYRHAVVRVILSPGQYSHLTAKVIIDRIMTNRAKFMERNAHRKLINQDQFSQNNHV